ncbi:SNAP receptor PEP12 [Aspergillus clavatus NRRL 1]|uniref:SNARE domain protein n=1 Tax=Aspergillus clavatus (strain ATCC 1007 / CBS 513.65 / DSM 816 / NCTC 3887 / NRRL 1 / QM 1276 / 107) TaxID=344612 RepID=A1CH21_ASPCL|nr:SNARE domain protein [Aspergillus clavatus NRRL 1]EAW10176.1 SNARE domain protein [Aspergillus clavatus NRRL 1]
MSFDRLDSLEAQPTNMRRSEDPHYRDDPEFDRLTEGLSNQLFTLTSNITRLSDQIALLGTKRDTERVRERVHNLLEETRSGFKDVGEGIKKVQTWEDVNPSQKWTQQKLSSEFKATLEEFQTVQRRALEKQRASAVAARTAVEEGEHVPADGAAQQQQQLQEQPRLANQDEVDFQEALIIERETEIRNIEQSVGELNELFRDVAHIVHEQGGQLDIISENVERVTTDTRGANVELRSASRYQKNARNKACCLLLILGVILVIIVLAATLG